jgi:murein DD-endopeptidase MepM/ murein hydrolase activator NlpD
MSARVFQENCGTFTHFGEFRHCTDFVLEAGDTVVAARGGEIIGLHEHDEDGRKMANYVLILHDDQTVGCYVHFMPHGILVEVGDVVGRGDEIGLFGSVSYTGPTLHLHFRVHGCRNGCESIPITFRNADPPDEGGLVAGVRYTALPHGS